jgi:hypothetical protein
MECLEEKKFKVIQIRPRAIHTLEDLKQARVLNSGSNMNNAQQQHSKSTTTSNRKLNKPTPGRMKCNIDVSFSSSLNKVGTGLCIRDEDGSYVLAKIVWFSPFCSVEVGEALGLYHALIWTADLQ